MECSQQLPAAILDVASISGSDALLHGLLPLLRRLLPATDAHEETAHIDPRYQICHGLLCWLPRPGEVFDLLRYTEIGHRWYGVLCDFTRKVTQDWFERTEWSQSSSWAARWTALQPDCGSAWAYLGSAAYNDGQYSRATGALRSARSLSPQVAEVATNFGDALYRLDDPAAEGQLRAALEIDPHQSHAHALLGRIARSRGDLDDAQQHFMAALSTDPGSDYAIKSWVDFCLSQDSVPYDQLAQRALVEYLETWCNRMRTDSALGIMLGFKPLSDAGWLLRRLNLFRDTLPAILGTGNHPLDVYLDQLESWVTAPPNSPGLRITWTVVLGVVTLRLGVCSNLKEYEATSYTRQLLARCWDLLHWFRGQFGPKLSADLVDVLEVLELRIQCPTAEKFAEELLRTEPQWLDKAALDQAQGIGRDLGHRLALVLNLNVDKYLRHHEREHLDRLFRYIELLKGQAIVHHLTKPTTPAFRECARRFPVGRESVTIALDHLQQALRQRGGPNPVAISFHFSRDILGFRPPRLIVLWVSPDVAELHVLEQGAGGRLEQFTMASQAVHRILAQMAPWHRAAPNHRAPRAASGPDLSQTAPGTTATLGTDSDNTALGVMNGHLDKCYEVLIHPLVSDGALDDQTVWVSPAPEMCMVPFGLLRHSGRYLLEKARAVITVPIFSLAKHVVEGRRTGSATVIGQREWHKHLHRTRANRLGDTVEVPDEENEPHPFEGPLTDGETSAYGPVIQRIKNCQTLHIFSQKVFKKSPDSRYRGTWNGSLTLRT